MRLYNAKIMAEITVIIVTATSLKMNIFVSSTKSRRKEFDGCLSCFIQHCEIRDGSTIYYTGCHGIIGGKTFLQNVFNLV